MPIRTSPIPSSNVRERGDTNGGLLNFERECVVLFSDLAQGLAVPRSLGQIYGLLFASPCPLSFTDIVDRLPISKGSASQGLQLLRSLGAVYSAGDAVVPRRDSDDRRERFLPEMSLRRLMGGVLREKVQPMLGDSGKRMRRLRQFARLAHGTEAEFSIERIKQLEAWRRQLGLFLPLIRTFLVSGRD